MFIVIYGHFRVFCLEILFFNNACATLIMCPYISPVHVSTSRHLMSSRLFFFLRWLLMRCLLMRNLLTFSTKKSHMSRYLKSSLLTSLYRFIHQDTRRLLMSDLFVEKVSRFLMSRHLMSSHLKKKKRRLLMRCLLIDKWTGLMFANDKSAS